MFSSRLLKFALTGAFSVLVLVTAVLGAGRWRGDSQRGESLIGEFTEIIGQQRCSLCGRDFQPLAAKDYLTWQGKNRAQLEEYLADLYPGTTVVTFDAERVEVQFPAITCPQCSEPQWPQQGYIGLTQENFIAIFLEDGTLFHVYAEAPGDVLDLLAEGIPFTSPEECEDYLINLTS